jgi:glutathione S-transferase
VEFGPHAVKQAIRFVGDASPGSGSASSRVVANRPVPELLGLSYSPWSEKARFALDVRRVPYVYRRYQPLLGEPALRLKLRRFTGRVTVPVLTLDDGSVLADSTDIARWADGQGEGPRLFPPVHEAAIARFVALSERGLAAGRVLSLRRMLADDEALTEMLPRPVRRLGPLASRIGAMGIGRTLRKYGGDRDDPEAHRRTLTGALEEIRATLAKAPAGEGPQTLLGQLTFADIAVAQILVSVEPPPSGLKLGPASRRTFVDPALRAPWADLVAWRDALYRAFRAPGR